MTAGTHGRGMAGRVDYRAGYWQTACQFVIFGGIVAQIPNQIGVFISQQDWGNLILFSIITVLNHWRDCYCARRPAAVFRCNMASACAAPKSTAGRVAHIPLRVNSAGMIPLIFAQSLMIFPSALANSFRFSETPFVASTAELLSTILALRAGPIGVLFLMVVGFTYFYTDVIFKQQNLYDNFAAPGRLYPWPAARQTTELYLNTVLQRITLVGALLLGGVAILPWIVHNLYPERYANPIVDYHQFGFADVVGWCWIHAPA